MCFLAKQVIQSSLKIEIEKMRIWPCIFALALSSNKKGSLNSILQEWNSLFLCQIKAVKAGYEKTCIFFVFLFLGLFLLFFCSLFFACYGISVKSEKWVLHNVFQSSLDTGYTIFATDKPWAIDEKTTLERTWTCVNIQVRVRAPDIF